MCSDTSRGPQSRCVYPGCDRTVWQDPDGSYSSFCGRGHREGMKNLPGWQRPTGMCKNCLEKPVYIANGRQHDFCGIRCATAYQSGARPSSSLRHSSSHSNVSDVCRYAGCRRLVHIGRDNVPGEYCSDEHRRSAVQNGSAEECLFCGEMPKVIVNGERSDFCSYRCGRDAVDHAPIILNVPPDHDDFVSVNNQFTEKWLHNNNPPIVERIWKIYGTRALNDQHARYKLAIERKCGINGGNTRRRWHGTVRACNLGDTDRDRDLCMSTACWLCSIIRSSFQLARQGQRTNFGRFGHGIYTSATSSKANDYIGDPANARTSAMLLNSVVMGKPVTLTVTDQTLTAPPQNADSVVGEPGHDLRYDESIVYNNDAIRPLYLVVYRKP